MEKESYSQEFDTALQRELSLLSEKGYKVISVILFGSMSNTSPRLDDDQSTLKSDADILVITEASGEYNEDKEKFNIRFGDKYSVIESKEFSARIPKAEIFIRSVRSLKYYLKNFINDYKENDPNNRLFLYETAILQALAKGNLISGIIPEELNSLIKEAIEILQNSTYRVKSSNAVPR